MCPNINTTGVICGAGTPYSSGVHARFLVGFVWLIMVFCVPIISTNVLNSNQTCTRASDELGRHVSQSNKEKIMMGQYIDLALLLKNSKLIEASNQQKNSIVQGQLVMQQKQQPKITNIELWTDAFLIFFLVFIVQHMYRKFRDC